ncbi:S41 family peptidase [Paenibacillus sp. NPDC058177]|uniref:S41 family peptidase n=1 Tax=Paenibacillus sp. NPDC058177 TaxID=3346369 RepID=UPI0036DE69F1
MLIFSSSFCISKKIVRQYLKLYEENELELIQDERYTQKKRDLLGRFMISPAHLFAFIEETKGLPYTCFRFGKGYPMKRKRALDVNYDIKFNEFIYIKIPFFNNGVSGKIKDILQCHSNYRCLILDLRNHTGGILEECVKTSRLLLPSCEIVELRYPGKKEMYLSDESRFSFQRIFIWVNGNTVSCGEILALTLRKHLEEATVIGNNTAGKNIGQRTFDYKRKKWLFSISAFSWTVEGGNTNELRAYLKKDNPAELSFSSEDDYYRRIADLVHAEAPVGERA